MIKKNNSKEIARIRRVRLLGLGGDTRKFKYYTLPQLRVHAIIVDCYRLTVF